MDEKNLKILEIVPKKYWNREIISLLIFKIFMEIFIFIIRNFFINDVYKKMFMDNRL